MVGPASAAANGSRVRGGGLTLCLGWVGLSSGNDFLQLGTGTPSLGASRAMETWHFGTCSVGTVGAECEDLRGLLQP